MKQNTVKSSTFGVELIAFKIATDLVESLHYELRIMGVLLAGSARMMGDNQVVVISSFFPKSTLRRNIAQLYATGKEKQ